MIVLVNVDRLIFYAFLWAMLAIMLVGPWMYGFTDRKNNDIHGS